MNISGVSLDQFRIIVNLVSHEMYGGNAIVHADSKELPGVRRPRCQATVTVRDPRGPGSRVTRMGVHRPYACWHLYRDVLAEVFRRYPDDAVVRTSVAVYRGQAGFLATYPATRYVNVGSQMEPVTLPELCQCSATLSGERDRELHGQPATYVTQAERLDRNQCEHLAAAVHSYVVSAEPSYVEAQWFAHDLVADVKRRQAEIDREFPPDDTVFGPRVRRGTSFGD